MDTINALISRSAELNLWIAEVLAVIAFTAAASRVRGYILHRIERMSTHDRLVWKNSLATALRKPSAALIWIAGLLFAAEIVLNEFNIALLEAIPTLRYIALIAVVTWFVMRFIDSFEIHFVEQKKKAEPSFDVTTTHIVTKMLRIIAVVLGVLIAMQTLGMNIAGILALGGVGGIAVGFASRELIANYFGGLMIYLDRPFKVGETITSSDRDIEGTIMEIGWRQTVIQRFDTRTLYVPNGAFSTIAVRNMTRQSNRRIYEYVGIRYDDAAQLAAIVTATKEMIQRHPDIDQNNSIMVNFDRFAASSLDFFIYCFTKTTVWAEYHAVKQDILIKTMNIIDEHGAQIAFPTSTLHFANQAAVDCSASDKSD